MYFCKIISIYNKGKKWSKIIFILVHIGINPHLNKISCGPENYVKKYNNYFLYVKNFWIYKFRSFFLVLKTMWLVMNRCESWFIHISTKIKWKANSTGVEVRLLSDTSGDNSDLVRFQYFPL